MSLGNILAGAMDPASILQQLAANGGNIIIINAGASEAEGPDQELAAMGEGDAPLPPLPIPPGPAMAAGPDVEGPVEDAVEPVEEPADMMGAAKAALLKK